MSLWLIFILLAITLNAQNVWYVDRDATGANTGRSWTDAWNTLDSSVWLGNQGVNWAIIGDGDTIYVSGGADSTCYYPLSNNLYNGIRREASEGEFIPTFNEEVVIAPAWQSGHDGDVYVITKNDDTYNLFVLMGINNVKITGVTFYDTRSDSTTVDNGLIYIYGNDNTIENCVIHNAGLTGGFYLAGTRGTIRGCTYTHIGKDRATSLDPIGISDGRGFHTIEDNYFIIENVAVETPQHIDFIQISGFANKDSLETSYLIIRNNVLIATSSGIGWNAILYTSGAFSSINYYIYNNLIVARNDLSDMNPVFAYQFPDSPYVYHQKWYVFNNTFLFADDGLNTTIPIGIEGSILDTLIFKNNIIVADSTVPLWLRFQYFFDYTYFREVDNNGYFENGGLSNPFYIGEGFGTYTYAQWRDSSLFGGDLYDANSLTGNSTDVSFVQKYGSNITDYYTETGRDLGANIAEEYPHLLELFPDIAYDILGNPRTGSWDLGALEYQQGIADTIPSFSFTAINNAELSTEYIASSAFDNADSTFSVWTTTSASFKINYAGTYSTAQKTADQTDTVFVKNTTGGSYSTAYTETILAGGQSQNFVVTTKATLAIKTRIIIVE